MLIPQWRFTDFSVLKFFPWWWWLSLWRQRKVDCSQVQVIKMKWWQRQQKQNYLLNWQVQAFRRDITNLPPLLHPAIQWLSYRLYLDALIACRVVSASPECSSGLRLSPHIYLSACSPTSPTALPLMLPKEHPANTETRALYNIAYIILVILKNNQCKFLGLINNETLLQMNSNTWHFAPCHC